MFGPFKDSNKFEEIKKDLIICIKLTNELRDIVGSFGQRTPHTQQLQNGLLQLLTWTSKVGYHRSRVLPVQCRIY